jgi:pimeloyl-ACP methyl ester carboxylesterase
MSELPNIVLVHGAWADGSIWSADVERLQKDGYSITAPQFPETSLADDVGRLRQADALLLDATVALFDTDDARRGIETFLATGAAAASYEGH